MVCIVEGLYCKRPIKCQASYEILTPSPPGECVPPPPSAFGARGGHTRWAESGWGVNSSEDARHCSVLYICMYFVVCIVYYPHANINFCCKFMIYIHKVNRYRATVRYKIRVRIYMY
jgi:hypothetical protein